LLSPQITAVFCAERPISAGKYDSFPKILFKIRQKRLFCLRKLFSGYVKIRVFTMVTKWLQSPKSPPFFEKESFSSLDLVVVHKKVFSKLCIA